MSGEEMLLFTTNAERALQDKMGGGVRVTVRAFSSDNDLSVANMYPPDTTMIGADVWLTDGGHWRCVMPLEENYDLVDFLYAQFAKATAV